jgi:hypothetical protein
LIDQLNVNGNLPTTAPGPARVADFRQTACAELISSIFFGLPLGL